MVLYRQKGNWTKKEIGWRTWIDLPLNKIEKAGLKVRFLHIMPLRKSLMLFAQEVVYGLYGVEQRYDEGEIPCGDVF